MDLNDLLQEKGVDPHQVLVLRHRPPEPRLNKVLGKLAAQQPEMFNAYQQTQGARVEQAMTRVSYVASFIGHKPGRALFVGLYSITGSKPMTREEFWQVPAYVEMRDRYGMTGWSDEKERTSLLWFNLVATDFYSAWKGKLIVGWPPPEIAWFRRADRSKMPVLAILEDSALEPPMREWRDIDLEWEELGLLSERWKAKLSDWRGIYFIFDASTERAM